MVSTANISFTYYTHKRPSLPPASCFRGKFTLSFGDHTTPTHQVQQNLTMRKELGPYSDLTSFNKGADLIVKYIYIFDYRSGF